MIPQQARRAAPRAFRLANQGALRGHRLRFQSTTSSSGSGASTSHWITGVAGGAVGAALFYGIYSFTPAGQTASKINKAAAEASKQYKVAADKLQKNTPNADQAIDYIKEFAYSYVGWVPGGRAYVDTAFKDIDLIREKHKDEVDKIVSDAYKKLQEVSKAGLSTEALTKTYEAIAELSRRIADLSGDAISDILDNHPQVKEKLGGNVDKLKTMGDQYGPEAKKQVQETWDKVRDIFAAGFSVSSFDKAKKLIEEKVQQVQKLGDDAWNKGMEELKPYLDKNPKVKELVEENAKTLKSGNVKELFDQAKSAVDSGNLEKLQNYVKETTDKAKSKGSEIASDKGWNLEEYFNMIPEGGEILPKLQELGKIAKEHKEEGQKLFKETIDEVKKVLDEKSKEAQKIAESAKKETKSKTS